MFTNVSIPESGFCLFGVFPAVGVIVIVGVSIPESGFCLFGQTGRARADASVRFQSLSRDSVCLAGSNTILPFTSWRFQSLSRDSVCLADADQPAAAGGDDVSIPESGFCLFGHRCSF